jgi:hypothetical protein
MQRRRARDKEFEQALTRLRERLQARGDDGED